MQFPARNVDVYMVDMERIEVLEGPQGTLFGGGAEAGAIRYITNKPKLDVTEGNVDVGYGYTAHGDPNTSGNAVLNLPLIADTLAVRAVDLQRSPRRLHRQRAESTSPAIPTRSRHRAPISLPVSGATRPPANNYALAERMTQNPVTYQGIRASLLWQINDDWNVLIQQTYQDLDAEGMARSTRSARRRQPLAPLQETSFSPAYDKDKCENTAWTVNGKIGDLKAGLHRRLPDRTIDNAMDYTNYARSAGGFYYTCTGGGGPPWATAWAR